MGAAAGIAVADGKAGSLGILAEQNCSVWVEGVEQLLVRQVRVRDEEGRWRGADSNKSVQTLRRWTANAAGVSKPRSQSLRSEIRVLKANNGES